MKKLLLALPLTLAFIGCHDGRTWESDTNGPPANMVDSSPHTDISAWPEDNRTGNPAYHLRKEREKEGNKTEATPEKPH
jgi:hypothetical protein